MDWYYSRMFKSQEAAREQNRREQRRLNLDMEEKRAGHLYNMETVRREQREIERELEKIRQGAHNNLLNIDVFSHHIRKSTRDHIINIVSPTKPHERRIAYKGSHRENTFTEKQSHQIDNHGLFDALLYLEHNPEAMNQNIKQSDSQSERMALKDVVHTYRHAPEFVSVVPTKLQKMSPDPSKLQPATGAETMPTMTNVMLPNISKSTEMNVNLLNLRNFKSRLRSSDGSAMYKMPTSIQFESHSSQNRNDVLICIPENGVQISPSPRLTYPGFKIRDQESETKTKQVTETNHHLLSPVLPNFKESPLSQSSFSKPTRSDLLELSNFKMQAARENVTRRLSTVVEEQTTRRQSVSVDATNRPLILSEGATNLGAISKDKISQMRVPITLAYEQERYNPDGSLRTVHQLPDQQKSWEEAKKARYIRSRDKQEHETELTINEIFNKPSE